MHPPLTEVAVDEESPAADWDDGLVVVQGDLLHIIRSAPQSQVVIVVDQLCSNSCKTQL